MGPAGPAMSESLAFAIAAVQKAGEIQLARRTSFHLSEKSPRDVVTDVDVAVETMFRAMVAERFPTHGVMGEELAESHASAGVTHRWLFDPIDGTANYASGLPFFCASLA